MFKVRSGSVLSAVVIASACLAGCAQQQTARPRAESEPVGRKAQTPQPEELPCSVCRLEISGRVTGQWQDAECVADPSAQASGGGAPPVAYPVREPRVEVVQGDQEGMQFTVAAEPESFDVGMPFEGTVDDGATPKTWVAARLVVTDAEDKTCASVLAIDK